MTLLIYNVLSLVLQTVSGSQGPPPPQDYGTDGVELPIDENLWILIIAGIALGIYAIYRRKLAIGNPA